MNHNIWWTSSLQNLRSCVFLVKYLMLFDCFMITLCFAISITDKINHRNFGKPYLCWWKGSQDLIDAWLHFQCPEQNTTLFKASCSINLYTEIFLKNSALILLIAKVYVARGISIEVHFTEKNQHIFMACNEKTVSLDFDEE